MQAMKCCTLSASLELNKTFALYNARVRVLTVCVQRPCKLAAGMVAAAAALARVLVVPVEVDQHARGADAVQDDLRCGLRCTA